MKRKQQNKGLVERRSSWRFIVMIVFCVLLFVAGFFLAGRQHFSSMDFGMKNSKLRKQIEDLESEKRRLILAREISLSPNEIRKAAKKVGLIDGSATVAQAQPASSIQTPAATRPASPSNPLIMKTAAVASTAPAVQAVAKSPNSGREPKTIDTALKQIKRTVAAE